MYVGVCVRVYRMHLRSQRIFPADFTILPSEITVISPRDLNDVQHLTCSVCFHHTNKPGNVSFQWTGALTGEEASTAQDSVGCAGVQKRSTVQVKVSVLLKYLWLRCSVVIDNRIQRQRTFILDPKFGGNNNHFVLILH